MSLRHIVRRIRPKGAAQQDLSSREDTGAAGVFRSIFLGHVWAHPESRSGEGASVSQTERIRAILPRLFSSLGVRSMLDLPCGDWAWMRLLDPDLDYIGADIVPELVEANQRLYGNPRRRFVVLDVTRDPLPRVDLVLCRDLLVHLSFANIKAALETIRRSGSTYLLTTTFPGRGPNQDIETGRWRPLDLEAPPISLPPPIQTINEGCTEWDGYWEDKSLGLWRVSALSTAFNSSSRNRIASV